jgi:hypothetical protein
MPKSARAELVEALSFSFSSLPKKKQPFDKLRASGDRFTSLNFALSREQLLFPSNADHRLLQLFKRAHLNLPHPFT